jgi:O-antigen ligase
MAFWCLMAFTFIVLMAPQNAVPALRPLNIAFVTGGAALGLFLLGALSRGVLRGRPPREVELLGLFGLLAFGSIPLSWWPGGSWDLFFGQLLKSLIVYVLASQLLVAPHRFRQHLWLAVMCGIGIATTALVSFRGGAVVGGYRLAGSIAGLTANPNDLALTLNLFLPFGLLLCATASVIGRLVATVYVLLTLMSILLSFSRAGFLTLVAIGVLFFGRAIRRRGLPVLLGLASLALVFSTQVPTGYGERISTILDHEAEASATARLADMTRAVRVTLENPIVGVGLGQNMLALNANGGRWHVVHNVYLQISTDLGIPALVVFLILFGRLVRQLRAIQSRPAAGAAARQLANLAGATEVSLWAYVAAGMFYPVAYHFYFFYIAGFASALHTAHQRLVVPRQAA